MSIDESTTGACWVCGARAMERCDFDYRRPPLDQLCGRWLCDEHLIVEGDEDGVDMRCAVHAAPPRTVQV
jgi:hypothetical protein